MKTIIAVSMVLFSSMVFAGEESVMKCQMNIMNIKSDQMIGEPRFVSDVLLTANSHQFYVVVGERVISSPVLSEYNGNLAAYHSGAAYFMRKDSFGVIYDDFGYVFDECLKVA